MSNSTTNLDLIAASQANKEVTANSLFSAASPAMLYGRRDSSSAGLTWGYYGGTVLVSGAPTQIANGTVTLTASTINYVEANPATGVVSANTTGFTSGYKQLYAVVAAASTVTSYTDLRTLGGGEAAGVTSVNGQDGDVTLEAADVGADAAGTAAATVAAHAAAGDPHPQYLTSAEGAAAASAAVSTHEAASDPHPQYQKESEKGAANGYASLDGDGKVPAGQLPAATTYSVFGASGASHSAGLVPDPGAVAGTTKFLREDGSWSAPSVSTVPGGADTQIQFNDGGAFGGDADLTWDKTNNILYVGSSATPGVVQGAGGSPAPNFTIKGGTSATSGNQAGTLTLSGGAATTSGKGGVVAILATNGVGSGGGGDVTVTAGNGSSSAAAGTITITGGTTTGTGTGGTVTVKAGRGGSSSGAGGTLLLQGGTPVSGTGGGVSIQANAGVGTNQNGGSVTLTPGAATGTGTPGHVVLNGSGAALATTAIGGFTCIPTCAGAPTGVPAGVPTGTVPMVFDTTNFKLWIYTGGAWKGVALA